jgi:diguanylate cyclase (GGDEF)-like protein/PAS domain S-box-containing protein
LNAEQPERAPPYLRKPENLLDRKLTAWLTLSLMIVVTLASSRHAEQVRTQLSRDRFLLLADSAKEVLADRMEDYAQVLRGGAALFDASGEVSRAQWRAYVEGLKLDEYLPGIQGAAFARMMRGDERLAHERAVRAEGFPTYRVHPPGERDPLSSIVFIEPFEGRNLRAFGYDMYTHPVRREAMDRARDTGMPALSGKVTLVQETGAAMQPGFLMYVPVYRGGGPLDTVEARRAALHGFVYSPFRAFDLMNELFGKRASDVEIELFDLDPSPANLLYDSGIGARAAEHVTDVVIDIAGHRWVARFHSSRAFEMSRASAQPQLIFFGGMVLALLLFVVLYMNAEHRHQIRGAAAALEQSRDNFRTLVENIPGAVFRSRIEGTVEHVSVGIESLTGEPRERYLSGDVSFGELIHPDDREHVQAAMTEAIAQRTAYHVEYRIVSEDGRVRWVAERGRATYDQIGRATWLDSVILDIDDGKRAELAVRELAFHDPLTSLPNRRLLLDRLEHQLAVAKRTGRPGALLFLDMDNFKTINDTLGHDVGDLLLIEVARRLRQNLRESDTVARLGGDEFVVLVDELGETRAEASSMATDLAEKILGHLNQPYQLGEHRCASTPSIGIAIFVGDEASPDEVLRRADQAMYDAKKAGRNRVRVHGE